MLVTFCQTTGDGGRLLRTRLSSAKTRSPWCSVATIADLALGSERICNPLRAGATITTLSVVAMRVCKSRLFARQSSLICSTRFSAPRTPRVHLDMQTWRRIYLDAQTRSLLGAVDCSSIERPHSNPAPFANVKIHGLTLPCVNECIKSGRKCAERRLKHFHD